MPDVKQLRLSEDAVLHMRRIVDEFSYATDDNTSRGSTKQRLHQLLFEFFDTFGSHVFRRQACSGGTPDPLVKRKAAGCSTHIVGLGRPA